MLLEANQISTFNFVHGFLTKGRRKDIPHQNQTILFEFYYADLDDKSNPSECPDFCINGV